MSGACRTPFRKPWHLTSAYRPNTLLIFSLTLKSFRSTAEISKQHAITIKTHLGNLLSAMICGVVELVVVFQPNCRTLWETELGWNVHQVFRLSIFLNPSRKSVESVSISAQMTSVSGGACVWTHSTSLWPVWQELVPGWSHGSGAPFTTVRCLPGMWICHSWIHFL